MKGVYRHVRNPMISGVFFILLGEAVSTGSLPVLGWAAVFVLGNIYIPLVEEPGLAQRFGTEYEEYRKNVSRWVTHRGLSSPWRNPRFAEMGSKGMPQSVDINRSSALVQFWNIRHFQISVENVEKPGRHIEIVEYRPVGGRTAGNPWQS